MNLMRKKNAFGVTFVRIIKGIRMKDRWLNSISSLEIKGGVRLP